MWEWNKVSIRGRTSKNQPDWLPLHIHVSPRRFIAFWHDVRTISVSYVARLSHYQDLLARCSFKHKMYTAPANKTSRVCGRPLYGDGDLCFQSPGLITGGSGPRATADLPMRRSDGRAAASHFIFCILNLQQSALTHTSFFFFLCSVQQEINFDASVTLVTLLLPVVVRRREGKTLCHNVSCYNNKHWRRAPAVDSQRRGAARRTIGREQDDVGVHSVLAQRPETYLGL